MQVEPRKAKVRREADQRRRIQEFAQELSATLGADFFQSIVKHLAQTFQADCVYLGELIGAPVQRIRTLAACRGMEVSANFEVQLEGTAAGQAMADGSFACAKQSRLLFPLDELLQSLDAQGFVGIRLSDSKGQAEGLLAMISSRGFTHLPVVRSVLDAFIPRAASELERKRSEDAQREIEERHQAFISNNPDAMWRIELEQPLPLTLPEEEQIEHVYRFGYFAECNDALVKLAGVKHAEDVIGTRFGEFANRINPGAREELRSAVLSGFRSATVEVAPFDAAGQQVYRLRSQFGIVEQGALHRIWGTTRDISDLRRVELSLEASEKRFREVLEGIQLPAVMLDLQGSVTFANECFLKLSKRSWEELSALTWLSGIVPERERAMWKTGIVPDERGRLAALHFEGEITPRSGRAHTVAWDTIGLYTANNQLDGMAAIGRDITRQKALETEVRVAQKLESIGRLAAGVAHDFNNLLMIVSNHTDQLLRKTADGDPLRSHMEAIENAASQCVRLTSQLMAFGRKQHLYPKPLDLNELISGDERIIRSLIGGSIALRIEKGARLGVIHADMTQIQRVLANLVSNARDAMPDGGALVVSTSNLTVESDDPAYPGIAAGSYVRLTVEDNGAGLTEESRAHLFEPFFTTKAAGKGTGLGLATVYGIVTQSGGHIVVHGEPGRGTRFDLLFPVARESRYELGR